MPNPSTVIERLKDGQCKAISIYSEYTTQTLKVFHQRHASIYTVYAVDDAEVIVCDFNPCRYCVIYPSELINYWADDHEVISPDEASARWIRNAIPMADINVSTEDGLSIMVMTYNGHTIRVTDDRNPNLALREVKYYIDGKYDPHLTKQLGNMFKEAN